MKKWFFFLIVGLLFLLMGCSQNIKYKINIVSHSISKNAPLKIITNFNYENLNMTIDSSPVSFIHSPEGFYLKNLRDGFHKVSIDFLDKKRSIITNVSTTLYYDSTPPKLKNLTKDLTNGILTISFTPVSNDYAFFKTYINNTFYKLTKASSITIPIKKDSKNVNIRLDIFDKLKNKSSFEFNIDTSKDSTPIIVSNTLKLNLFSVPQIKIKDDWDQTLLMLVKKDNSYVYPYKLLTSDSTESTVIVFDSSKNYCKKYMSISVDKKIPRIVKNSTILLSDKDTLFSWETDPNIQSYVVEHYEKNWGWKPFIETDLSFAEVHGNDIMFVRKKTKNNTLGFPSAPIYRFSSNINFYSASTLENIKNSTYLLKINSPFFIPFDILIDKNKTLFVESGSEIRFSNNARLVIKGTLFIMEGSEKSKLSGRGTIYLDGGTIIIFDTDVESINIEGRGKVIFIQNSNFLNDSTINLTSITRFCSYSNDLKNTLVSLKNSSGIYIDSSSLNLLKINNISETLIRNSNFNSILTKPKSRILFEDSNSKYIFLDTFSYLYSYNSNIQELKKNGYDIFIERKEKGEK